MKFPQLEIFDKKGRFPDHMKYSDGTYADALLMMKKLGGNT